MGKDVRQIDNMISVIICSTNAQRLERVSQNIAHTIGVPYEIVVRNNLGSSDGIGKVYNELAIDAKGEVLCFVHEDVEFCTPNWGVIISEKAMESQTGIIGFVGSAVKTKTLTGSFHAHYSTSTVTEGKEGEKPTTLNSSNTHGAEWAPVVTVDGLCMIMRGDVWRDLGGFDQKTFPGFHLYDLDLSTAATVKGYHNFICCLVQVIHYSRGNHNQQWYDHSIIYHHKWANVLPLYINRPSDTQIKKDEKYMMYNITYFIMKCSDLPSSLLWERVKKQWIEYPLYHKSYYHLYRYFRYQFNNNFLNK